MCLPVVYKTRPLEKGKNMPLLKSIVCVTRNWVGWDGEHSCYAIYWVELDRRSCSHEHLDVVGAGRHRSLHSYTCTGISFSLVQPGTWPRALSLQGRTALPRDTDSHFLHICFLPLPYYSLHHGSLHHDHHLRL